MMRIDRLIMAAVVCGMVSITACKTALQDRNKDQDGPSTASLEETSIYPEMTDDSVIEMKSLSDPREIAQSLGLTPDQEGAFMDYWEDHQRRLEAIAGIDPSDIDARRKAMKEAANNSRNKLKEILTDEQLRKYRASGANKPK